jgi:hypothetical protein
MPIAKRFPKDLLAAMAKAQVIGLRAGRGEHRFIGIWAVVVEGRVFVRSWSLKPRSWWRTFLEDPYGAMTVGEVEIPVRAVRTRSERLKALVSQAYKAKYKTPGAIKFARDMARAKSRDTTTELVPLP